MAPGEANLHRDIVGPFCCRARLRETHRPGCKTHTIPALRSANEGPWRHGVVVEMQAFGVVASFAGEDAPRLLSTLWMDRFRAEAGGAVERDDRGRPVVHWSQPWRVLKLLGRQGNPVFDVADAERSPDAIAQWLAIPAQCSGRHRKRR